MKNALGTLSQLQATHLQNYVYIRALTDCYVCNELGGERIFRVYSNYDVESLYPISSENLEVEIDGKYSDFLVG